MAVGHFEFCKKGDMFEKLTYVVIFYYCEDKFGLWALRPPYWPLTFPGRV